MTRKETIERTFAALDQHLRKASLAQLGGFRPPDTPYTAWFGGNFIGYASDEWPTTPHGPMLPLLQVIIAELPYCPPPFPPPPGPAGGGGATGSKSIRFGVDGLPSTFRPINGGA